MKFRFNSQLVISILFVILIFLAAAGSAVFGQRPTALTNKCPGGNGAERVQVYTDEDGNVQLNPCAGKQVLVNGIPLQSSGGAGAPAGEVNLASGTTAALSAAINVAQSYRTGIITFADDIIVDSSVNVPASVRLKAQKGALIVKSGAGKINCAADCIGRDAGEYQQIFTGFAPGDIAFGDLMPSEINPVWFGAKPDPNVSANATGCTPGYDSLPAVKTIQEAFTRSTAENVNPAHGGFARVGTKIKFPAGNFCFSGEWQSYQGMAIAGVENNVFNIQATQFWFPAASNGLVLKAKQKGPNQGNLNGNIVRNLSINQYASAPPTATVTVAANTSYTDFNGAARTGSVLNLTGGAADFGFPLKDGMVVTFANSGQPVLVSRVRDESQPATNAGSMVISNNQTRIKIPGFAFTAANVGDDLFLAASLHTAKITGLVAGQPDTVDVDYIDLFEAAPNGTTTFAPAQGVIVYKNERVAIQPITEFFSYTGNSRCVRNRVNLEAAFVGSTFQIPGANWSATVAAVNADDPATAGTTETDCILLDNPVPTAVLAAGTSAYSYGTITNLQAASNVPVVVEKYSGLWLADGFLAEISGVVVNKWRGNGFSFSALGLTGNNDMATCNHCSARANRGHGFYFLGEDSHEQKLDSLDATGNAGWGLYDLTGYGQRIFGGHMSSNNMGTVYQTHDSVNTGSIYGLYTEGGSPGMSLGLGGTYWAGTNSAGVSPYNQGTLMMSFPYGRQGYGDAKWGLQLIGTGINMFGAGAANGWFSARLTGDSPCGAILIGADARRGNNHMQTCDATDWGLMHSAEGAYFGAGGNNQAAGNYVAGMNLDSKAWNAKKLEIGDGTDESKAAGHNVGVMSGNAPPASGNYPFGFLVLNATPTAASPFAWRNTSNSSNAAWEALYPAVVSETYTSEQKLNVAASLNPQSGWTDATGNGLFGGDFTDIYQTTGAFDAAGQSNAAPEAVYRTFSYRLGAFTASATIGGLTSGATYIARLHVFQTSQFNSDGGYSYSANVNGGTSVAVTTAPTKAMVKDIRFTAAAATAQLNVTSTTGVLLSALEIVKVASDNITASSSSTLTNKTISGASNSLSNIPQSAVINLTTDLAAKATLASPSFSDNPTAPTPGAGDNDTSIATTAFVQSAAATRKFDSKVYLSTETKTLTAADSGGEFMGVGATFNLPTAVKGMVFTFHQMNSAAAQNKIVPPAGSLLGSSTNLVVPVNGTTGAYQTTAGASSYFLVGRSAVFVSPENGVWVVVFAQTASYTQ